MMQQKPAFVPPVIHDNPDGWGPSASDIPEKFQDLPYAPFSKSDKLGRCADWTGQQQYAARGTRYSQQPVVSTVFNYYHVDEDESFTMVDTRPVPKPKSYYPRGRFGQARGGRGGFQQRGRQQGQGGGGHGQQPQRRRQWGGRGGGGGGQRLSGWTMLTREAGIKPKLPASVEVRPEWALVEDIDFPSLNRLYESEEPAVTDLASAGEIPFYNDAFDHVTTKSDKSLEKSDKTFAKSTTSEDPVIKELAEAGEGNVFATSAVLAQLMACPRSVYSWDLLVRKQGDVIFFDKPNYAVADQATVNERMGDSSGEQAVEPINAPEALTREATLINQAFAQQVLAKTTGTYRLERPNPFVAGEEAAKAPSIGYLYRRFSLGEDLSVVVRCEVDAAFNRGDAEPEFLTVKALNEWDSKASGGVDWRQKLDSQRGAVLASELKTNSFKLARWTVQALLSDVQSIKLGYVARIHAKDASNHVILGVQTYKPTEFATQISLSMSNCWGILKHFVATIRHLPDGDYVLLKDPAKGLVHVYDTAPETHPEHKGGAEEEEEDFETPAGQQEAQ
jgi:translation initiation factor 3 subunit D